MLYDNPRDARLRLAGTYVHLKGEPCRILEIAEDGRVTYAFTSTPLKIEVGDLEELSQHIDISPMKLGFINHQNGAHYLSRLPIRKYKQGTCSENVKGAAPLEQFDAKPLDQMFRGLYPSFEDAVKSVTKTGGSKAFSRKFCVQRVDDKVYLYYKENNVGMVSKDKDVTLGPKFQYLQQMLNMAIEGVSSYA